jgi:hypothetical protein
MPPLSVLPTVVPVAHELLMCTVCFDLPEGIVNQVAAFAAHSTVLACSHLVTYAHTHTRPRMASVYHYLHHPPPPSMSHSAPPDTSSARSALGHTLVAAEVLRRACARRAASSSASNPFATS